MRLLLETDRLVLREITPADNDDLFLMCSDDETMRYIGKGGAQTREQVELTTLKIIDMYEEHGFGLWAVLEKGAKRVIGRCGFLPWEIEGSDEIEIAYMIARDHWGKGYATEAVTAIRDWGREHLGAGRFISMMREGNTASTRVAEKMGMRYEKTVDLMGSSALLYSLDSVSG